MTLAGMVQDAASGLFLPSQARRQVIPYDDLSALSPSVVLPQISPDLISALSILVAQGPNKPLLLTTDANGRLQVVSSAVSTTKFAAGFTGGTFTATVVDSSSFYPGQFVSLIGTVSGTGTCTQVGIKSIPDAHTIIFNSTCGGLNYTVGDIISGGGDVRVTAVVAPVDIGGTITMLPPGSPNPGDQAAGITGTVGGHKRLATDPDRSCDALGHTGLVQPAAALLIFPAVAAGVANVLKWMSFGALNLTAGPQQPAFAVWDGAAGVGALLFEETFAVASTASQSFDRPEREMRGSGNTQMTLTFTGGAANLFEWINAGVVFEGV